MRWEWLEQGITSDDDVSSKAVHMVGLCPAPGKISLRLPEAPYSAPRP